MPEERRKEGEKKREREERVYLSVTPTLDYTREPTPVFFLNQFLNYELIEEAFFLIQFYDVNLLSSRIGYHNQI